jgi:aminoglycoside phosphotransferase (APT) family kinase protein
VDAPGYDDMGLVPELTPLPGGYSGETFLAESAGERSVVRIYAGRGAFRGADAAEVDAAVMRLVRGLVPVPEVLEVRRADGETGTPALLVTSWLPGRRLEEVLPGADDALARELGRSAGSVAARLAQMPMLRAGTFHDGDLGLGPLPPGGEDLPAWVQQHAGSGRFLAWSETELDRLRDLADRAQDLLDRERRTCLVHGDLNAKNVLVDPDRGTVTGVLDWEFAHAGGPFEDLGNLLRFDRRPAFADAALATYGEQVPGAPEDRTDLHDRARAADLFALVELTSRTGAGPVADASGALLLAMASTGDLHATPAPAAGDRRR